MEQPKISVIIPVYNVEEYLEECLKSVINQTLKEIEIICINDGSTDNTLKILKEYSQEDQRIKIIDKQNEGISIARNLGINQAKGEYCCFLDSDDWYDITFCKKLYNKAKETNSDIVFTCVQNYDDIKKANIPSKNVGCEFISQEFNDKVFNFANAKNHYFKIFCVPWNKLYKTEFLRTKKIYFPVGVWFEDTPFFYKAFYFAQRMSIVNQNLYFYRLYRNGSYSFSNDNRYFDFIKDYEIMQQFFIKENIYEELKKDFWNYKLCNLRTFFIRVQPQYKEEFCKLLKNDFVKNNLSEYFLKNLVYKNSEFYKKLICMELSDFLKYLQELEQGNKRKKGFIEKIFSVRNEISNGLKCKTIQFLGIKLKLTIKK